MVIVINEFTHWIPTPALQAQEDGLSTIITSRHHEERSDVMIQCNNSQTHHWIAAPALQESL